MSGPSTPARRRVWAGPRSLAATWGVAVAFLSSGYLDVSVHRVRSVGLCIQPTVRRIGCPSGSGCPIRVSRDQRLVGSFPGLIAASYALHRLPTPRHPPCALSNLTTIILVSRDPPGLPAVQHRRQEPSSFASARRAAPASLRLRRTVVTPQRTSSCIRSCDTTTHFAAIHFSKNRCRPVRIAEFGVRSTRPTAVVPFTPHSALRIPHSEWWSRRDLNPRPPGCKPGALPPELRPPFPVRNSEFGMRSERQPGMRLPFTPHSTFLTPHWEWWAQVESNHRPRPYQGRALAN